MKLVCVDCDERMSVHGSPQGAAGRSEIIFRCARCGATVALSINPAEAQLVGAMGIDIGGKPRRPFQTTGLVLGLDLAGGPGAEQRAIDWTDEAAAALLEVQENERRGAMLRAERLARAKGQTAVTAEAVREAAAGSQVDAEGGGE